MPLNLIPNVAVEVSYIQVYLTGGKGGGVCQDFEELFDFPLGWADVDSCDVDWFR